MTIRRALVTAVCAAVAFTAACSRRSEPATAEAPSLNVTSWTDKTELYMEYPPLVAGRAALFAVHLTRLADFKPLTAGRPQIEFTPDSGGSPAMLMVTSTVPGAWGGVTTCRNDRVSPFSDPGTFPNVTVVGQGSRQTTVGSRLLPKSVM